MKSATLSTRVDPRIKMEAEKTMATLGLTLSEAVNIFLHKVVLEGGLPFEVRQPRYNATTQAAIAEGRAILAGEIPTKAYSSFGDLLADLDNE